MLHFITDLTHKLLSFIKDDPVRPEISTDFRVSNGRMVAALASNEDDPDAMVCVSFHDFVPAGVDDLSNVSEVPTTAVFYTIWSYSKGSGRKLIIDASNWITENRPQIKNLVTLSPTTEMAERFHLRNGAVKWRINEDSVNYAYQLKA